MMISRKTLALAAATALSATATSHAVTVIYQQTFTPGAGTAVLNGTAPTTGANNWVAGPAFEADGNVLDSGVTANSPAVPGAAGSATLAFAPANGFVYTLSASFRNFTTTASAATPSENDWIALGFAAGNSTDNTINDRFISASVIGKAWMLYRGNSTANANNVAWLGTDTSGTGGSANWSDATLASTYGGAGMDMRVVLNTEVAGAWTATWFAKAPASGSYTTVRATTLLTDQAANAITSVGIARSNTGFAGDMTSFELTSVPEPSAALLSGLGLLALLRRRR